MWCTALHWLMELTFITIFQDYPWIDHNALEFIFDLSINLGHTLILFLSPHEAIVVGWKTFGTTKRPSTIGIWVTHLAYFVVLLRPTLFNNRMWLPIRNYPFYDGPIGLPSCLVSFGQALEICYRIFFKWRIVYHKRFASCENPRVL